MPTHPPADSSTESPKNFPSDSYAQGPESQVPRACASPPAGTPQTQSSHPDPLEEPATPAEQHTSWTERFLHGLFLFMAVLAVLVILVWLGLDMYSEVVSRRTIGHFQRMSGSGGLLNHVVIETETGFYPLWGTPVIAKGTPLVLEVRASGYHYICDESRGLCVQTTAKEFKQPEPIPSPSPAASSQGMTP